MVTDHAYKRSDSFLSTMEENSAGMNLLSLLLDSVYFRDRCGVRMTDLRSVLYL
jgi:hypothetical protein